MGDETDDNKPKTRYYTIHLPISLKFSIEELFEKSKRIKELYSSNKIKFIEDSIRRQIMLMDGMYKDDYQLTG